MEKWLLYDVQSSSVLDSLVKIAHIVYRNAVTSTWLLLRQFTDKRKYWFILFRQPERKQYVIFQVYVLLSLYRLWRIIQVKLLCKLTIYLISGLCEDNDIHRKSFKCFSFLNVRSNNFNTFLSIVSISNVNYLFYMENQYTLCLVWCKLWVDAN